MTYADASDASTWAFTRVSRRPQIKGTVRDPVRGFFAAFNAGGRRQPDPPPLQATRLLSITGMPQDPGVALGAMTPNAVRTKLQRELNFVAAFNAGAELAAEMVAADETDLPDPEIWKFALGALV